MASYGGEIVPAASVGSAPTSPSNYATLYPVYQIDFQAVAAGKRIATTKRRVRWRFGYPNARALEEGLTGTACRGEEHDVTIVWSITSGKREVSMDGREVHFSTNRSGILEFSWSTRGNHVIKILAHAAPPLSATPGFRQYDLWIDGQSFFSMPKVYELGLKGPPGARARAPGRYDYPAGDVTRPQSAGRLYDLNRGVYVEPSTREQEEADLQRAINESIEESRRYLQNKSVPQIQSQPAPVPAPAPTLESNLLDFGSDPSSAPPAPVSFYEAQSVTSNSSFPAISAAPTFQTAPPSYGGYSVPPAPAPAPAYLALPAPPGAMSPDAASTSSGPTYGYAPAPAAPVYAPAAPVYAPAPAAPVYNQSPAASLYGSPPPPVQSPSYYNASPHPQFGAPGPAPKFFPESYSPAPYPPEDPFASQYQQPLPPADDPFAPKPPPPLTATDINKAILNAYSSPLPETPGHGGTPLNFQSPLAPGQSLSLENGGPNGGAMTMNGYVDTAEPEPTDEIARALKKLVNIDRIDEPAEQEIKLTLKKEEEKKQGKKGKSKGLPPAATGLVGSQASLNQIKQVKPDIPKNVEGIMKQPPQLFSPQAVQAGALVIYGQSPPPGPPQGFGAGAYGPPPPAYGQPYYQQPPPQPGYYQQPPPPQYNNY